MASPYPKFAAISSDELLRLESACDTGMYLDLYRDLQAAFVNEHPGDHPRTAELAYRVANHLMLEGVGRSVLRRLRSSHPGLLATRCLHALELSSCGRIISASQLVQDPDCPDAEDAVDLAKWHSVRAGIYIWCRDFQRAEREIEAGLQLWSEHAWLHIDRIALQMRQDRLDEALQICHSLLPQHPDYPALRGLEAAILHELDDEEAALAAWKSSHEQFQSPRISYGYANCLLSYDHAAEARAVLEQVWDNYRLSKRKASALLRSLALTSRIQGDDEACLEYAKRAGLSGENIVRAMEATSARPPRVSVPVPFVRQDHQTCVPAVMATILQFFGVEVDQRGIADEITYDGTPDYQQLRWGEKRDLIVRYFAFHPDVARSLLDAGIPFTVSTRSPNSSHIQGIIGYDPLLETFMLREPGTHSVAEISADDLNTQQKARGGGCSLIIPSTRTASMPVDELPYEKEHMASVLLFEALEKQQWTEAQEQFAILERMQPCPLLWDAQRAMASERKDYGRIAEIGKEQLAAGPDDPNCIYYSSLSLSKAGLWEEYRQFLEEQAQKASCHPIIELAYAEVLSEHASTLDAAKKLARMTTRKMPLDDFTYATQANIYWSTREERPLALELYRIAACLGVFNEHRAASYYHACRQLNRSEDGIAHLRQRFDEMGARSSVSAGTLANALDNEHRSDEALAVLEKALGKHDDRWVRELLFYQLLKMSELNRAREHLEASKGILHPASYWQQTHDLEVACGNRQAALSALDCALEESPENVGLHGSRLNLLFELHGSDAANSEARRLAQQHDKHYVLLSTLYDYMWRVGANEDGEALLRRLVEAHPREYWLQGKLARHLMFTHRPEEALELQLSLLEHIPNSTALLTDIGNAKSFTGDNTGAREAYRQSLLLDANDPSCLYFLLQTAQNRDQAGDDLRLVAEQFRQRAPDLQSLQAFLSYARDNMSSEERSSLLQELDADYPGNPGVAYARCEFLLDQEEHEAALDAAQSLCDRFSWESGHHNLLARVLFAMDQDEKARQVLEDLCGRDPRSEDAFRLLGGSYENTGEFDRAEEVYQRGIAVTGSGVLHGYLAELDWRRGRHEAALAGISRACELSINYTWAHETRVDWLSQLERREEALTIARAKAKESPTWPPAFLVLAHALRSNGLHEESVEAMFRALALDPRMGSTRKILVRGLGSLGRYEEARSVAREGLELLGDDPELAEVAILVERSAGDHAGSRRELRELLERHPDYQNGWVTLLYWYEEDGEEEQILELHADPPTALSKYCFLDGFAAEIYFRRKDLKRAEEAFRRALEIQQGYDWCRAFLGRILHDSKRYDEEEELYSKLLDPDAVECQLAAQVARNAALRGNGERAGAFFARTLREQNPNVGLLTQTAELLEEKLPDLFVEITKRACKKDPYSFALINLASMHAQRGKSERFWQSIDEIWSSKRSESDRQALVAAVFNHACMTKLYGEIGAWLEREIRPPVLDVQLWGLIGLCCQDYKFKILAMLQDYNRPGAEGWMLANLAKVLMLRGMHDDLRAVSEHGLTLPEDHSKWWHRKYLAYVKYVERDFESCLALAAMPVVDYPVVKLGNSSLELLVEIRRIKGFFAKRRALAQFLPEIFRVWKQASADMEPCGPWNFFAKEFFKAIPCDLSLMLNFRPTRNLMREWYAREARSHEES